MSEFSQALPLLAMFAIGLMGAGHCVGMCGGIAAGLGFATAGAGGTGKILGYNLGRIASYAFAGALVATAGYWGDAYLSLGPWLRVTAGLLLILMGLYLAGWWTVLVSLERAGALLWRGIRPLAGRLLPVTGFYNALLLGMVWGWLPCGLVYTALAYAATSASPADGALRMAFFGLGTAPAIVAGGLFSERARYLLQRRNLRRWMGAVMIGFGAWTLGAGALSVWHGAGDGNPAHHHH